MRANSSHGAGAERVSPELGQGVAHPWCRADSAQAILEHCATIFRAQLFNKRGPLSHGEGR